MFTYWSVCSWIEAAQVAFSEFGFQQLWSSEIADFPSKVLEYHYPNIQNLGDMNNLPELIRSKKINAPDFFCGWTPCQAFSLAGMKNWLEDERGRLTMKFIEIADAIDDVRLKNWEWRSIIFWENVEWVLTNKTNPFWNFIAGLAWFDEEIIVKKWSKAWYLEWPKRNVAWRVLDAKFFWLPQQRKRLYVLAGWKDFRADLALFETSDQKEMIQNLWRFEYRDILVTERNRSKPKLSFSHVDGVNFEFFREYTDCLYTAYWTKWNGNAAAYNGSLFFIHNWGLRRLTPLECERLMWFPDNYTNIPGSSLTSRYQAVWNSWAVPVIKWLWKRIVDTYKTHKTENLFEFLPVEQNNLNVNLYLLGKLIEVNNWTVLNSSEIPNKPVFWELKDVVETRDIPYNLFLTHQAKIWILRRKEKMWLKMNAQLEAYIKNSNILST